MEASVPWFSLLGFEAPVHSCAFVQGTRRDCLATGCEDGMLLLWDLKDRRCAWQSKCHQAPIIGLQTFTGEDGRHFLASWGRDQLLQVWDVTVFVGNAVHNPTTGEALSNTKNAKEGSADEEDGEDQDMPIVIPCLEVKKELGGINFCRLTSLSIPCKDGRHRAILALADADNESALLVDTWTWNTHRLPSSDHGQLMALSLTLEHNAGNSGPADTTDSKHESEQPSLAEEHSAQAPTILVLGAFESGVATTWRVSCEGDAIAVTDASWFGSLTHHAVGELQVSKECPLVCLANLRDRILCGNAESKLFLLRLEKDATLAVHKEMDIAEGLVNSISVREGGAPLFACACSDGKTRVYSRKGTALAVLDQHTGTNLCAAHSRQLTHFGLDLIDATQEPGGILLATGGHDCIVHLWSLYNEHS